MGHFVQFSGCGGEGLEEEVIVVRHARVVEDAGVHRIASELVGQGLDVGIFNRFPCDELVELGDDHELVFGPGETIAFFGEEAGDALCLEGFVVSEGGDVVEGALLIALVEDWGFGGLEKMRLVFPSRSEALEDIDWTYA